MQQAINWTNADPAIGEVELTHWGRVTHICAGKLTNVGSDNGSLPGQCQPIIWTNAGMLLIEPSGINFSEMLINFKHFCFWKGRLWNGGHFVLASIC